MHYTTSDDDDFAASAPLPAAGDDDGMGGSSGSGPFVDEETLLTKEGLKKIKDELEHLKNVRRKEVAQRLKEAISYGDLSENSEYEEAKNEQAFVEGRILELEQKVKSVRIISEKHTQKMGKEVNIGSTVTVMDKEENTPVTYTIVGSTEADPFDHKISNESPIGKALLSRCKGETVIVQSPAGTSNFEILKVA